MLDSRCAWSLTSSVSIHRLAFPWTTGTLRISTVTTKLASASLSSWQIISKASSKRNFLLLLKRTKTALLLQFKPLCSHQKLSLSSKPTLTGLTLDSQWMVNLKISSWPQHILSLTKLAFQTRTKLWAWRRSSSSRMLTIPRRPSGECLRKQSKSVKPWF